MNLAAAYTFVANTRPYQRGVGLATSFLRQFTAANVQAAPVTGRLTQGINDAGAAAGRAREQFSGMSGALQALNAVQMESLREGMEKLTGAVDELGHGGGNFVSKIAGMANDFDKGFAGMAAKAGLYGDALRKEEKKIFSAAYALNMDATHLGENLLGLKKMGVTAEELGLKDLKQLGKVLEVTGLSGEQLGATFKDIQTYGFDTAGVQEFLNSFTEMTTSLGIGAEGFQSLDTIFKSFDEKFARTLRDEGPAAVEATTKSIVTLSAAMTKLVGGTPQDNLQSTIQLFEKLQDEANVLPQMMSGLDAEFGSLANELGVVLPGGFNEAMDAIRHGATDPLSFAKNLSKMYAEIQERGGPESNLLLQRMSKVISDELGPSFEFLFENGQDAIAALEAIQKPAKNGIKTLAALGEEGYRTGLTIDDQLQRIKDGFENTFKGIAMGEARKFVKSQGRAYKRLGGYVKELASGRGLPLLTKQMERFGLSALQIDKVNDTFGRLTKSASLFESGGLAAALTPFVGDTGAIGAVIGQVSDIAIEAVPAVTALGAIGFRADMLLKPFRLLMAPLEFVGSGLVALAGPEVVAVAGVLGVVAGSAFLLAKALDGSLGPAAQEIGKTVLPEVEKVGDMIRGGLLRVWNFVDAMDPVVIAQSITGVLNDAMGAVGKFLGGDGGTGPFMEWLGKVGGLLTKIVPTLFEKLLEIGDALPWGDFFEGLGRMWPRLFAGAIVAIDKVGMSLVDAIQSPLFLKIVSGIGKMILRGVLAPFQFMKGVIIGDFEMLMEKVGGIFSGWVGGGGGIDWSGLWEGLKGSVRGVGEWFAEKVAGWFSVGRIAPFIAFAEKLGEVMVGFFGPSGAVSALLSVVVPLIGDVIGSLFGKLGGFFSSFQERVGAVKGAVMGMFGQLRDWISGVFTDIGTMLTNTLTSAGETTAGIFSNLGGTIREAWDSIIGFFVGAWEKLSASFTDVRGVLGTVAKFIGFGEASATPSAPGAPSTVQVAEAKKVAEATDVQLYAKADTRALIEVIRREGVATRNSLGEIRDRIPVVGPTVRAAVAFPTGTTAARPK